MRIHGERPENVGQTASTQAPADRGRTGRSDQAASAGDGRPRPGVGPGAPAECGRPGGARGAGFVGSRHRARAPEARRRRARQGRRAAGRQADRFSPALTTAPGPVGARARHDDVERRSGRARTRTARHARGHQPRPRRRAARSPPRRRAPAGRHRRPPRHACLRPTSTPLRPELVAAQAALRRCERLGATIVSPQRRLRDPPRLRPLGSLHDHRRRGRPAGEGLMSGLFGMLSTTARSLEAQRYGLDAAGQNIANVNTPGYSRRVVDFGAVPPTSERLNAGNGVEVLGVRRAARSLLRSPPVPGEPGPAPRGGARRGARRRRVEPRSARTRR